MDLQNELNKLFSDNLSGSGQLLEKLKKILTGFAREGEFIDAETLALALNMARDNLPSFALVQHFIMQVERFVKDGKGSQLESSSLLQFMGDYTREWERYQDRLVHKVIEIVDFKEKTILLHSQSSTVYRLFRELQEAGTLCDIVQTISRPNREGVFQAQGMASLGHRVTLVEDAAMARFVPGCDMAFIGADSLHEDFLVNKIGSLPLALLCKKFLKPLYCLADERKLVSPAYPEKVKRKLGPDVQSRDPREIIDQPIVGLEAKNYYFEPVPYSYFERVFR